MKIKTIIIFITALFIIAAVMLFAGLNYLKSYNSLIENEIKSYIKMTYKIERKFIVNVPVYRDFSTPVREAKLRRYMLGSHRRVIHRIADRLDIQPFRDSRDIKNAIKLKKIVSLETGDFRLYYFHNVKKLYRHLTPLAKKGLELVTKRFQYNLQKRKIGLPPVKLAISSVLRPVDYQKRLFKRAFVSTHSYGTTFDIFLDDYFVYLPIPEGLQNVSENIRGKMHRRLGFLMGDALRRQFHAVLMETLIQLQDEGYLYAILEKRNRCYHITILKEPLESP